MEFGFGFGFAQSRNAVDPLVAIIAARIAADTKNGYTLTDIQKAGLDLKLKAWRLFWGRVPAIWHDAEYSVNRNGLPTSGTPATIAAQHFAVGVYTLHVEGSGSCLVAGVTGTITGGGTASAGVDVTFTVTVAGTLAFTVVGSLTFWQCEVGSAFTIHHDRVDTTAVKTFNLGSNGVAGDAAFTGTTANNVNMMSIVGSRRVYKSLGSASQYLLTTFNGAAGAAPRLMFLFNKSASSPTNLGLIGYRTSGTDLTRIRATGTGGTISFDVDATGLSITTTLGTAWGSLSAQNDGVTSKGYRDGTGEVTTPKVPATTAAPLSFMGIPGASVYLDGLANHLVYDVLAGVTATGMQSIHNFLKADVGL